MLIQIQKVNYKHSLNYSVKIVFYVLYINKSNETKILKKKYWDIHSQIFFSTHEQHVSKHIFLSTVLCKSDSLFFVSGVFIYTYG